MEGGSTRSVYFLLEYFGSSKYHGGFYKVQIPSDMRMVDDDKPLSPIFTLPVNKKHGGHDLEGAWCSKDSKLYVFRNEFQRPWPPPAQLEVKLGCLRAFDLETGKLAVMQGPQISKFMSCLISADDGKLYHLAFSDCGLSFKPPQSSFQCYDGKSWQPLEEYQENFWMTGYAICSGSILVSIQGGKLLAYHIASNEWHEVHLPSTGFDCSFQGRAEVLLNTIYALSTDRTTRVIAFSLRLDYSNKDSTSVDYYLERPVMSPRINSGLLNYSAQLARHGGMSQTTVCLVHLGDLNFCLLESSTADPFIFPWKVENQRLWFNTFRIHHGKRELCIMDLHYTARCVMKFSPLSIRSGFMLESEDVEPKEDTSQLLKIPSSNFHDSTERSVRFMPDSGNVEPKEHEMLKNEGTGKSRNQRKREKGKRKIAK